MAATTFTVTITMNNDVLTSRNSEVGAIKSALQAIIQDVGRNVGTKTSGDAAQDIGIHGGHTMSAVWTYTTSLTS